MIVNKHIDETGGTSDCQQGSVVLIQSGCCLKAVQSVLTCERYRLGYGLPPLLLQAIESAADSLLVSTLSQYG